MTNNRIAAAQRSWRGVRRVAGPDVAGMREAAFCLAFALAACGGAAPAPQTFTIQVTATNATVTPSGSVTVESGATQAFTVTPAANDTLASTVGGTCPAGSWAGTVYTTGPIAANCTVSFSAARDTYTVTASGDGNETFSPATPQTVVAGSTLAFTVTPTSGYAVATTMGGSCPAGTWAGTVYTTGPIAANCTVSFSATRDTYTVTASGDGNETFSPATPQTVAAGSTQAFTVTATNGSTVSNTVGGSCPAGSWTGAVYTTGPISANCTVVFSAEPEVFIVTPSGDGNETFSPASPQLVASGRTQAFTVSANAGDTLATAVGGTCPAGSWAGAVYTTGPITAKCTVAFSASLDTYTVTASGDGNETFSPSAPQTVALGSSQAFTVTPSTGYGVATAVGGTCPAGNWAGAVYTTGPITANCTVAFSASLDTYTVTASGDGNETVSPSTPQTVGFGSSQAFTVTPNAQYALDTTVGGTCPTGTWAGDVYTTGPITASCTVSFGATAETYTVTATGDGDETFSPATPQTVDPGSTQSFVVTANAVYTLSDTVGGSCPAGTWSGDVYTTGPITASCTVSFHTSVSVLALGDGFETISPAAPQAVGVGSTQAYTLTANTGYTLSTAIGGSCPVGSWAGNVYTTGPITGTCQVDFSATPEVFTVTPAGDGNETISPSTPQSVQYNSSVTFTIQLDTTTDTLEASGCTTISDFYLGSGRYLFEVLNVTENCTVSFAELP